MIRRLVFLILPCFASAAAEDHSGPPVYLEPGEQRSLFFPDLEKFSISGTGIRHWRDPKSGRILLKATSPGTASLFVSTRHSGSEIRLIRVEADPKRKLPDGLFRALDSLHATEVIDSGGRFYLRGEVGDPSEARSIAHLRSQFPGVIEDETFLSEALAEGSAKKIEALLLKHRGLKLIREEGSMRVEGAVENPAAEESLTRRILEANPLARVEIRAWKEQESTLYFKVFLLEVKKDLLQKIGTGWPGSHGGTLSLDHGTIRFGGSLDLTIEALSTSGAAKVLSSPELVVKAPGQAELFAGGELPVRQRTRYNDVLTWKTYGLTLRIDVKSYSRERVNLSIETEMSHLDPSIERDQIPGLKTNRLKTLVDGRMDKPLLLSGLLQDDLQESVSGLPGLSSIPVLGALFSSKDYQDHRSELVAILLPHLNPPDSPQDRIRSGIPKGFAPLPRSLLGMEELEMRKASPEFPWNCL